MLELFRKNHFLNSLLLLPYSFLLGIDSLFNPINIDLEGTQPLYQICFGWLVDRPVTSALLAIVFLFFQAAMINRIVIKHGLSRAPSLIPGMMYILVMNALPDIRSFHFILIGNFFSILFMGDALKTIRKYKVEKIIFNLGAWAALAGLFTGHHFILLLLALTVMLYMRAFSLREMAQSLTGFLVINFLAGTAFYVFGNLQYFISHTYNINWFNLTYLFSIATLFDIVILSILYFAVAICVFNYYHFLSMLNYKEQKKIKLFYHLLILCLPALILVESLQQEAILISGVSLAVFLGILLSNWKRHLFAEILHLCLVLGILYIHFQMF